MCTAAADHLGSAAARSNGSAAGHAFPCTPEPQHLLPGSPECRCSLGTVLALVRRPESSIMSGDCVPAQPARSAAYLTAFWKRSWLLKYRNMLDDHGAFIRSVQQLAALLRRSIVRRAAERSDTTPVTPSLTFVQAHSNHSVMKTSSWHALRASKHPAWLVVMVRMPQNLR